MNPTIDWNYPSVFLKLYPPPNGATILTKEPDLVLYTYLEFGSNKGMNSAYKNGACMLTGQGYNWYNSYVVDYVHKIFQGVHPYDCMRIMFSSYSKETIIDTLSTLHYQLIYDFDSKYIDYNFFVSTYNNYKLKIL